MNLARDLILRFPDGTAEIALAHRELDRQIALLLFPIDIGGARDEVDRGNLAQRSLRDRTVRTGRADPQVLNSLRAFAIFRCEAHDDREMPVAAGFIEIAGGVAADRHFDGGIDVSGGEAITGGLGAIDIDLDGGLAEGSEYRKIGNALHGGK